MICSICNTEKESLHIDKKNRISKTCEECFQKKLDNREKKEEDSYKKFYGDCIKCEKKNVELARGSRNRLLKTCIECSLQMNGYCPVCKKEFFTTKTDKNGSILKTCDDCRSKIKSNSHKKFSSHPKSKFWDYSKNAQNPEDVSLNSSKKFWFNCDKCAHGFLSSLSHIKQGTWCPYCANKLQCEKPYECTTCYCNSFASNKMSIYLDSSEPDPIFISKGTDKNYLFNCPECKHQFYTSPCHINEGKWCPYCANIKRCGNEKCNTCFYHSFASHEKSKYWSKENKENPLDVAMYSDNIYAFDCDKCPHTFYKRIYYISRIDTWCPYCVNQKRCTKSDCTFCFNNSFASNIGRIDCWVDTTNPRTVAKGTDKKYRFKCKECDYIFEASCCNVNIGRWCPLCKQKTEKKLFKYLINLYPSVQREVKFDWCKNEKTNKHYRYDFLIPELSLIIELDGDQHFRQVSNWENPEEIQKRDVFKMCEATKYGYSILRIYQPFIQYNKTIDLTPYLHVYEKPEINYLGGDNVY